MPLCGWLWLSVLCETSHLWLCLQLQQTLDQCQAWTKLKSQSKQANHSMTVQDVNLATVISSINDKANHDFNVMCEQGPSNPSLASAFLQTFDRQRVFLSFFHQILFEPEIQEFKLEFSTSAFLNWVPSQYGWIFNFLNDTHS